MNIYIIELSNSVGIGTTVIEAIDHDSRFCFLRKRFFKVVSTENKNEYRVGEVVSVSINHPVFLKQ